ncbi:NYN domain-containing protein [Candidatus Peregrinibacteria bacterium]|nr:NYN domain-containing protein [Candidatus Peregrinibacteria bacterium]
MSQNLAAHSAQRVGVFIDTQNLYHSAKSNFRSNVNYEELIYSAVAGRNLIRAFAYVIKSEENTEEKFFDALEDIGIEIRVKDLQIFHTGVKKADWDVGIAVDMIRMTEKLDTIVLASGDGDFLEVIRYCKSKGVRVEVMAFEKTSNSQIIQECDLFIDLAGDNKKYIISSKKVYRKTPLSRGYSNQSNNSTTNSNPKPQENTPIAAKPSQLNSSTIQNQYQNLGLPSYLRQKNQEEKLDENIYSKKTDKRKIKPVVGMPAKKSLTPKRKNTSSNSGFSINNAFGNSPSK